MINEFKCKQCELTYKSASSRSNHIKRVHRPDATQHPLNIPQLVPQFPQKNDWFECLSCDKLYSRKDNLTRHQKTCKILIDTKQKELEEKANDAIKMKALEDKVNKLEKLITAKNSNTKTVNNNNNNGTIINNNIHINELGRENILNKLTLQEQINIATCHLFNESPHVEMVRLTYTKENCLENQNTLITNLQNKSCQVFNHKSKKFEATNKSQHIDNIIHYRKKDVAELSETLKQNKKVYKKYGNKLEPIEPINPEKDKEEITYIIYNNRGQVMQMKKELDKGNYIDTEEDDEDSDEEEEEINEPEVKNIIV
jgi:hypothetical protein